MEYLGIEIDDDQNKSARAKDVLISKASSKVKVIVITTDEEFVIASDTQEIVEKITG
jgi:acetate kinase